jgi:hypothetical protein
MHRADERAPAAAHHPVTNFSAHNLSTKFEIRRSKAYPDQSSG